MEKEIIKKHLLELEINKFLSYVHKPFRIKKISKTEFELISDYSDEPEIFDNVEKLLKRISFI